MQSKATTVAAYLSELPADRRAAIEAVRKVILKNLDKGYIENMSYGMITWCVPHSIYPAGYHCDPKQAVPFAALASQKNYMSVYLCNYASPTEDAWFRSAWKKSGKKLDMGKCCVRFRKLDDLALEVIGEAIRMPVEAYIDVYESSIKPPSKGVPIKATPARAVHGGKAKPKSPTTHGRRPPARSRSVR